MNNLAEKYIGIKEPDFRSLATNKDLIFTKKKKMVYIIQTKIINIVLLQYNTI